MCVCVCVCVHGLCTQVFTVDNPLTRFSESKGTSIFLEYLIHLSHNSVPRLNTSTNKQTISIARIDISQKKLWIPRPSIRGSQVSLFKLYQGNVRNKAVHQQWSVISPTLVCN